MKNIEVKNLSYRIKDKAILDGVNLAVCEKKFVGILGPNGSGKTSFLRHIYRTLPVQRDRIFINGNELNDYTYREASKLITVMKQENHSEFDYSIMEMVMMGRTPHRKFYEKDTAEDYRKARKALEYVGLAERMDNRFGQLSGGEKQRVLLARSIAQDAEIFLLDEPTNNLDIYYQWKLIKLIRGLDKTVVAILHEMNLAFRFCDYIYVLDDGKIHSHGLPEKVINTDMLREVMKIDAEIVGDDKNKSIIVKDTV